MVDIHCHILPEVDDGPKSWEVAVEMSRIALADGIDHIVASPHANDRYAYDREYLAGLLAALGERVGDPALKFSLGCDFHLSYENLQDVFIRSARYVIGSSGYLLVEFSNYGIPPQMTDYLFRLMDGGITPIITHPERYPALQRNLQRVVQWADDGCVVQVTASALTGHWGELAQTGAWWLLERDAVHVLASDAHDAVRRPPVLSPGREAVARSLGADIADALVEKNPRAIVAGEPLPYFPDPVLKG